MAVGTHTLTAVYGGDAGDATISLTSAPNPSTYGQSVTLTAHLAGFGHGSQRYGHL